MPFMTARDYQTITAQLAENDVVLFLGPLFGLTEDLKMINLLFREELVRQNFMLDGEFENFFILKGTSHKTVATDLISLRTQYKRFYESLKPHRIYEDIAMLKFKAIVNCTHDLYMEKALKKYDIDHYFSFFSVKNVSPQADILLAGIKEGIDTEAQTVLYNVYGSYQDQQSLISDYESFYQFLISLLSAKQEIPQQLKTSLERADVFIFLGFDLTKWYIPLMIRKLFLLANNTKVACYATLDVTPLPAAGPAPANEEERYSFLYRYPSSFLIAKENSIDFIQKISAGENVQREIDKAADFEVKDIIQPLLEDFRKGNTPEVLEKIADTNFKGPTRDQRDLAARLLNEYAQVNRDFDEHRIDDSRRNIELGKIRRQTQSLIWSIGKKSD